jgi:hypothetical protein
MTPHDMKGVSMSGRIYLLDDNSGLIPMEETAYESEKLLQELLAKYPDLLAGEQMDSDTPPRWLLVTRPRFHVESIRELCRVSRDVRLFPLLELAAYEFQREGNQMMRVRR